TLVFPLAGGALGSSLLPSCASPSGAGLLPFACESTNERTDGALCHLDRSVHICSGRIAYGFLSGGGQGAFFLLITIHHILPLSVCMRASHRLVGSVNRHGSESCASRERQFWNAS